MVISQSPISSPTGSISHKLENSVSEEKLRRQHDLSSHTVDVFVQGLLNLFLFISCVRLHLAMLCAEE